MSTALPPKSEMEAATLRPVAVVQLLVTVFVIPVLFQFLQYLEYNIPLFYWIRIPGQVEVAGEYLGWSLQIGLVACLVGRSARNWVVRWLVLFFAGNYLLWQGSMFHSLPSYVVLTTVLAAWLVWDASQFAWRAQAGTILGCLLVAAWYSRFGRDESAFVNTCLSLHCVLINGAFLLLRGLGWKLAIPDSGGEPEKAPASFSFSQLMGWVTCCGVGLFVLRFVEIGSTHTWEGWEMFQSLGSDDIVVFVALGLVAPLLGVFASATVLHERLLRYWLIALAIAIVASMAYNYVASNFIPAQIPADALIVFPQIAAAVTALLMVYRAAGYRWAKRTKRVVGQARYRA